MLIKDRISIVTHFALILILVIGVCSVIPARATGTILYVKWDATGANNGNSWMDAYTDLQSAFSAASGGNEIWVAAGTYRPTAGTDRSISFTLKNNVVIFGGFVGTETARTQRDPSSNITTLSGDIGVVGNNSDNSYHVVIGSNTNRATILDGFTISNGYAEGGYPSSDGGGLYSYLGNLTLSNLIFKDNSAIFGGGMYSEGYTSYNMAQPVLTNVTFINNAGRGEGGGMENRYYSQPTLTNVSFIGNTSYRSGGGMLNLSYCDSILTNVTFSNNTAVAGGGLSNIGSNSTLTNVTFNNNFSFEWGGGMDNAGNSNSTLTNVTFTSNSATTFGGAISNQVNATITLTNVTINGNSAVTYGDGIYNESGSSVNIRNSILFDNGEEIYGTVAVTYSIVQGGYTGAGNIDTNPLLGPLQVNGGFTQTMALLTGSPAIDAGDNLTCATTDQRGVTRPQGTHCDMGAYEYDPRLYVNSTATGQNNGSSWTNAYTDLQSALVAASSGNEIWVAAGTYKPTTETDRTISFALKNGVAVYGGFAGTESLRAQRDFATNVTVLSGDIGTAGVNTDNSYHVVIGSNTNSATILDGFTISGGNADWNAPLYNGGGVYSYLGSFVLSNLIIKDNAAIYGGGMFSEGQSIDSIARPTLTNVTFINNTAIGDGGGMENKDYSQSTLTNVSFIGNTSDHFGGGMSNFTHCDATMTNVTFSNNIAGTAGGLANIESNLTLANITFSNNASNEWDAGGMFNYGPSSTSLTNVTFNGNSATMGGGAIVNMNNATLTLTHVTINGNSSSIDYGDGIYNSNSNLTIHNSILYGNGEEIYEDISSSATVTHSIVQGGYAGTGNLNVNPLLNPLADNGGFTQTMALSTGSPTIDMANDSNCPTADQRAVSRPQGSHCDIGAYEALQVAHGIPLLQGWNLVSFRVHPTDTSVSSVLSSIEGNYDLVYAWDATGAHAGSGNWLKADNVPASPDSLTVLNETMGFWVHMTSADTLEVVGTIPQTTNVSLLDNAGGWNLVAYPSTVNGILPNVVADHGAGTDFSLIYAYHPEDPGDAWKLFDTAAPPFVNDLTQLVPNFGYWVKVNSDHTWVVEYSNP